MIVLLLWCLYSHPAMADRGTAVQISLLSTRFGCLVSEKALFVQVSLTDDSLLQPWAGVLSHMGSCLERGRWWESGQHAGCPGAGVGTFRVTDRREE